MVLIETFRERITQTRTNRTSRKLLKIARLITKPTQVSLILIIMKTWIHCNEFPSFLGEPVSLKNPLDSKQIFRQQPRSLEFVFMHSSNMIGPTLSLQLVLVTIATSLLSEESQSLTLNLITRRDH